MNDKKSLPTLDDVARLAGVSTATVSRALSRPDVVSKALSRKVASAVSRLGYVPHAGARALMLRRSGTVGAVFPTIDNAIFASAINALQRRLAASEVNLLIATCEYNPEIEMRQAVNLLARGADALALCGFSQTPELLRLLDQRQLPSVHVMVHDAESRHCNVGFDNAEAMAGATRHLIDLGHRNIAMLAGITLNNDRALQRVEGVRRAMAKAGLQLPVERLQECRYELTAAREAFRRLMQCRPAPTALICGNDILAFAALFEARSVGLEVPRDLSIVGFDDLEMARHVQPALTTVQVPNELMWSTAADRLLEMLAGQTPPRNTRIDVALVVRDSTGPTHRQT